MPTTEPSKNISFSIFRNNSFQLFLLPSHTKLNINLICKSTHDYFCCIQRVFNHINYILQEQKIKLSHASLRFALVYTTIFADMLTQQHLYARANARMRQISGMLWRQNSWNMITEGRRFETSEHCVTLGHSVLTFSAEARHH